MNKFRSFLAYLISCCPAAAVIGFAAGVGVSVFRMVAG